VILSAAWITAHPIELITFSRRIEQRVHQERIREDIAGRYTDLQEELAKRGNKGVDALVPQRQEQLQDSEEEYAKARAERDVAKRELSNLERAKNAALAVLERANKDAAQASSSRDTPDSALVQQLQANVVKARSRYNRILERFGVQQGLVQEKEDQVSERQIDVDNSQQRADEAEVAHKGSENVEKLRIWARKLRESQPGRDYPAGSDKDPETGFKFTFVDYDFLGKFRIIDDLLAGRPVRWPGADREMIERLRNDYGMHEINDDGTMAETAGARGVYWAIFGVAVIIPLMSLLFKLIMPSHLAYYYSSAWQSRQGNPWAMALEATIYSLEKNRKQDAKAA